MSALDLRTIDAVEVAIARALQAERHREYARRTLARLAKCGHADRVRRPGHGTERLSGVLWKQARRHLRKAAS